MKKDNKGRIIIPESFDRIKVGDLEPFDVLLLYNGNWITAEHGESWQEKKYGQTTLAPYHTNTVYDIGATWGKAILMDTEIKNTASLLEAEYMTKEKIRIDVVRQKDFDADDKTALALHLEQEMGSEAWYGILRFGSFAKRLKYVGWAFKWIKPSDKQVVCSGRVAKGFELIGDPISAYPFNETIPNDILVWALKHPQKYAIFTVKKEGEIG